MKTLLIFILLCNTATFAGVQDSTDISVSKEIKYDLDSHIEIKKFDETKIEELKRQDSFNYIEYPEQDTWWTQLKKWVYQLFMKFLNWAFDIDKITGFWAILFRILPYLLIVGILFLIGWLFMKVNPKDLLFEKQHPGQIELHEDEDIIQNQNIQQLIDLAIQNNNYRLAVRYYYLLVLKKLSELDLILWESQKTNTDYTNELSNVSIKNQFEVITRLYDFIWYGNFQVTKKSFQQAEKEFKEINQLINQ